MMMDQMVQHIKLMDQLKQLTAHPPLRFEHFIRVDVHQCITKESI